MGVTPCSSCPPYKDCMKDIYYSAWQTGEIGHGIFIPQRVTTGENVEEDKGNNEESIREATRSSLAMLDNNYGAVSCQFDIYTKSFRVVSSNEIMPFANHHFITFKLKKNSCYVIGFSPSGLYLAEFETVDGTYVRTIAENYNVSNFLEIVRRLDDTRTYNIITYNCQNFVEEVEQNICNHIAEETHS